MSLDRTVKWIDKTQGRDKFCKSIQYACRFLKFHYEQKGDLKMAKKIDSLFGAMRDSRKLFRLFKTINEYKKISDILKKNPSINVDNGLSILTRAFFGVYWIFDNLAILSKLKIFDKDPKTYSKTGATFWLLALLTNLISIVKDIIANEKKVEHLKRSYLSSSHDKQIQEKRKQYLLSEKKRHTLALGLLKTLGDIIPAGQGSQVFENLLGFKANEKFCGLGGLLSAVISCYQLYE